jgi:hypothetical protein
MRASRRSFRTDEEEDDDEEEEEEEEEAQDQGFLARQPAVRVHLEMRIAVMFMY